MRFEDMLSFLKNGKLIRIKNHSWYLVRMWEKNIQNERIYIYMNSYMLPWNPEGWQLDSEDWEVIKLMKELNE